MKNISRAAVIGLPAITGYATFLLSGIVMWFFMMYWFFQWWGILGVLAAIVLPPLSVLFPFIYWIQESFPVVYFLIWLSGVLALTLGLSLTSYALRKMAGRKADSRKKNSSRSRDIIEGEIVED